MSPSAMKLGQLTTCNPIPWRYHTKMPF